MQGADDDRPVPGVEDDLGAEERSAPRVRTGEIIRAVQVRLPVDGLGMVGPSWGWVLVRGEGEPSSGLVAGTTGPGAASTP